MKVLVCDDSQKVLKLLQNNSNLGLSYIIQMNSELSDEAKSLANKQDVKLYSFDTALEIGRIFNLMHPQQENVCSQISFIENLFLSEILLFF
jgi:hypothetical protein